MSKRERRRKRRVAIARSRATRSQYTWSLPSMPSEWVSKSSDEIIAEVQRMIEAMTFEVRF